MEPNGPHSTVKSHGTAGIYRTVIRLQSVTVALTPPFSLMALYGMPYRNNRRCHDGLPCKFGKQCWCFVHDVNHDDVNVGPVAFTLDVQAGNPSDCP